MARVLLGMSGGVDSSVAAAILKEQGHEVIGMTIKTYSYDAVGGNDTRDTSCCSLDGINDARRVARVLGIRHYVTDLTEEFGSEIISYFKETYLAGQTPNPCVKCNREIKWAAMLRKADSLGCDFIATGHYARLREEGGRMVIGRATDNEKDQTYTLWAVREAHLSRTLFPLSEVTKSEVREIARRLSLPIAQKKESFEICFVTDNDYRRFLRDNVEDLSERAPAGNIMLHGDVIGRHEGLPFYTVGQRKGLGVTVPSHPAPLYVTGLDVLTNTLHLGDDDDLLSSTIIGSDLNLIKYAALPATGLECMACIRYKDEGAPAIIYPGPRDDEVRIEFEEPRRAVTPGQSVVFYEGDDLVGGAIIQSEKQ